MSKQISKNQDLVPLLQSFVKEAGALWTVRPKDYPSGQRMLEAEAAIQIEIIKTVLGNPFDLWHPMSLCGQLVSQLAKRNLPYTEDDVRYILKAMSKAQYIHQFPFASLLRGLQNAKEILSSCASELEQLKKTISEFHGSADKRKLIVMIDEMIGDSDNQTFEIAADDWGSQANTSLEQLEPSLKTSWVALLRFAQTSEGSKPSNKWLEEAKQRMDNLGVESFERLTLEWLGFLQRFSSGVREETHQNTYNNNQTYTYTLRYPHAALNDVNVNIIKGLIWCFSAIEANEDISRMLARATEWSLKKVIGLGPRAPRIANAAIYVLGQQNTPASISQLARLKTRVTFKTSLKEIEKALDVAAQKAGISKADLEEMGVPSFGLEAGGVRREDLGEASFELGITGNDVRLSWFDAKGKQLKNPPSSVKKDFAEDLKELKTAQKDIAGMLSTVSSRLDNIYLAQKSWSFKTWRERYLEHPLVGTVAKRLIWKIGPEVVIGLEDKLVNVKDEPLEFADDAKVTLWHPIGASLDEIVVWREWLEQHSITQPFKQAHREVYLLTDAECRTEVYSNRYAAHILKQHQFNALCALRGWKNKLRLMVDDSYPPATLELPRWNLRAEFWVEGAGTEYGTDTNETGTYLYLATDQVRFYQMGSPENSAHASGGGYEMWLRNGANPAQPLALERIPALVFSEVMRDVDLFVGVCSVGNDATWQDGGPQGRYREYWVSYSFGELNATAETRKALLEKLIPRLNIASRCKLEGRFLKVRGDLRSYKIHLGSSNILMEPNDQYLCIVPGQSSEAFNGKVFLPFEGDRTLSVILSKAFLLAEDTKIKDTTITSQINFS
jgi:hypothetical protein